MNNTNNKSKLSICTIGNCTRRLSTLDFIVEKSTKNLYHQACCEPDLFWRSKCGRQGGKSLNERCAIKDKESSKIK